MAEEKAKEAPAKPEKGKEGEDAGKKPKKALNKKALIIAAIVVADLGLMAGLGFFIVGKLKGGAGPDPAVEALKKHEEEERLRKEEVTRIGHVLPKPLPFTVNINGEGGESHYLKCAIQLEWEGAGAAPGGGGAHGAPAGPDPVGLEIEKRMPKITDIIINILSSQTHADLLRPAGKQKIKESIVSEINAILPEPAPHEGEEKPKEDAHAAHGPSGKLRNAFFTEFIVQ